MHFTLILKAKSKCLLAEHERPATVRSFSNYRQCETTNFIPQALFAESLIMKLAKLAIFKHPWPLASVTLACVATRPPKPELSFRADVVVVCDGLLIQTGSFACREKARRSFPRATPPTIAQTGWRALCPRSPTSDRMTRTRARIYRT